MRVAQKMGYHRDGELLGLSPFETEMRRRIWWQIIMQDAKNAMVSGLSHALLPLHWDTKSPQNVNDADLFPTATGAGAATRRSYGDGILSFGEPNMQLHDIGGVR